MKNNFSLPRFNDFQNAYREILSEVYHNGEDTNGTHELIASGFTVEHPNNMIDTIRCASTRYAIAELIWYWAGSNSLNWINKFSNFWNELSDDGETSNSAYGYIIHKKFGFNQIDKVVKEFKHDKNTRRATIKINTPRTSVFGDLKDLSDTADEFCTLSLQFLIRDDKLDMIVNMRSNDLWTGLPYDSVYFVSIMDEILDRLKDAYPELEKGTYTHFAGSIHIYQRDLKKVNKILCKTDDAPRKIEINTDYIRKHAKELYDEVSDSFFSEGKMMDFKEYKNSKRFEEIIKKYDLIKEVK